MAAAGDDTIDIFDMIGAGIFEKGITAKSIAADLRQKGKKDVRVRINSPGGNVFEGLSIYNLLRTHKGRVDVEVVGIASSAASIVAMAADEITMGPGTFFFVHNSWGAVIGNRHDMIEASEKFEQFDEGMLEIYAARTGGKEADIRSMMDKETFLDAEASVKAGFADRVDDSIKAPESDGAEASGGGIKARRQVEAALAGAGFTRNQRSELLLEAGLIAASGGRDAAGGAERDAGNSAVDYRSEMQKVIGELKSFTRVEL